MIQYDIVDDISHQLVIYIYIIFCISHDAMVQVNKRSPNQLVADGTGAPWADDISGFFHF